MGNCLVKKIKATVDNGLLLKPGEFLVEYGVSESTSDPYSRVLIVNNMEPDVDRTLRILGDGNFTDSTYTQNLGKTITVQADATAYVSNVATKVAVGYEYRAGNILIGYSGKMDIDQLKYNQFTNCAQLRLLNPNGGSVGDIASINHMFSARTNNDAEIQITGNKGITGDIAAFDFSHVKKFRANNSGISGNIESISAPYITEFRIGGTECTGSIENMLVSILNSGNDKTVTMNLAGAGKNMTWNGEAGTLQGDITVTFASNSITVAVGGTIKGTYNGSSWSYNS